MNGRLIIILSFSALSLHAQNAKEDWPKVEPSTAEERQKAAEDAKDAAKAQGNEFRRELPDALQAEKEAYEEERKALRDALKSEIAKLGRGASREQVNDVVAKFRSQFADAIEAQKEKAKDLQDAAKELAKESTPSAAKQGLRALFEESFRQKKEASEQLKMALSGAKTGEERDSLMEEFRNQRREQHDLLKEQLKKVRDEFRNQAQDGDRRADD